MRLKVEQARPDSKETQFYTLNLAHELEFTISNRLRGYLPYLKVDLYAMCGFEHQSRKARFIADVAGANKANIHTLFWHQQPSFLQCYFNVQKYYFLGESFSTKSIAMRF